MMNIALTQLYIKFFFIGIGNNFSCLCFFNIFTLVYLNVMPRHCCLNKQILITLNYLPEQADIYHLYLFAWTNRYQITFISILPLSISSLNFNIHIYETPCMSVPGQKGLLGGLIINPFQSTIRSHYFLCWISAIVFSTLPNFL